MTIFQLSGNTYDMIKGGYGSPTYVPEMVTVPDPTYKLESGGHRISLENVDFDSLAESTVIDPSSLTFCIKSGVDDTDAVQVYGTGVNAFKDTLAQSYFKSLKVVF